MVLFLGLLLSLLSIHAQPGAGQPGQYQPSPPTTQTPSYQPSPPPPPPRGDQTPQPPPGPGPGPPPRPNPTRPPPPPPGPGNSPPPPGPGNPRPPPGPGNTRPPPPTQYSSIGTSPAGPPSYDDYGQGTQPPQCNPVPTPCVCPSDQPSSPPTPPTPYSPSVTSPTPTTTRYTPPTRTTTTPTTTAYVPPTRSPTTTQYSPPATPPVTTTRYIPPSTPATPTTTRYVSPTTRQTTASPGQYSSPTTGGYVASNAEMQAAAVNCASTCSSLASRGSDAVSTDLLGKMSTALQSCGSLTFDQDALTSLTPSISRMRAVTASASSSCKQQPLPTTAQNNLSRNLVWWTTNGYNPTPQLVQNLFNTASQFLEQYC
ncbi:hypothetical protein GCK32_015371 [Trichostrongylus colubriformis]|uniref:Uncharacterized protein n=1 Tax=Trichostrongylus colubriformis TaxID=6319 RepID=A0AAN8F0R0_TRICO